MKFFFLSFLEAVSFIPPKLWCVCVLIHGAENFRSLVVSPHRTTHNLPQSSKTTMNCWNLTFEVLWKCRVCRRANAWQSQRKKRKEQRERETRTRTNKTQPGEKWKATRSHHLVQSRIYSHIRTQLFTFSASSAHSLSLSLYLCLFSAMCFWVHDSGKKNAILTQFYHQKVIAQRIAYIVKM